MTNKDKKLQGIQIDDIEVEDVSYIYIIINTLLQLSEQNSSVNVIKQGNLDAVLY